MSTAPTSDNNGGGMLGAAKRLQARFGASMRDHDGWAIRLVFAAGILTILHKAGVAVPHYAVLFAVALGIAALLYEMNACTYALRSFWSGRAAGAIGWAFVWIVAFAYSVNQWVGAASDNEAAKVNLHKAAHVTYVDHRDALAKAARDVERIDARLGWMETAVNGRAVRAVEAAQADLDNAQAHRFWKVTDGCRETKGQQTREFCGNVAAWRAEKALAGERETLKVELQAARQTHADAKTRAQGTKTETFEKRADNLFLTKYAGMKEDDALAFNAVGSVIAISIFLSIATMLSELEKLRSAGPRTPFGSFRWLRALMFGKPSTEQELADAVSRHGSITVTNRLEDNRGLPAAAEAIARLTDKYRVAA